MKRLTAELVGRICQHLCPHCQSPDSFPHSTTETRQAKTALARLSRTSRSMRVVAQPFVFHYYATGNLPEIFPEHWGGYSYDGDDGPSEGDDRLPRFLHTIIERPDLAKCVQGLQLVGSGEVDGCLPWRKKGSALSAVRQASIELDVVAFNFFHPYYDNWTSARPDPRPTRGRPSYGDVHHTLGQLAILLCPNLSMLFLMGDFSRSFYGRLLRHSSRTLPALKTVGVLSESRKHHYAHAGRLLALATNLETIYAADLQDCELPYRSWTPAFDGPFPNARKVVAHNLGPIALSTLIQSCPQLRDFQYAHTADFPSGPPLTYRDIVRAVKPVRTTLRRLAFLIQTNDESFGEANDESDGESNDGSLGESNDGSLDGPNDEPDGGSLDESLRLDEPLDESLDDPLDESRDMSLAGVHVPIKSLAHFEALEELVIPHEAIYGRTGKEQRIPGGFARLLPRSISKLPIIYSEGGDTLKNDLEALARDAPRVLPKLRSVTVSWREVDWFPRFGDEDVVAEELEKAFAAVGIVLGWDTDDSGDESQDIPGLVVEGVAARGSHRASKVIY